MTEPISRGEDRQVYGRQWPYLVLSVLLVITGTLHALRYTWLSDDAFISFRYAKNFTQGLGLVFNAGERVEGYTNFLWTIWMALGLRLGFAIEHWANSWSIACYTATIGVLAARWYWDVDRQSRPWMLPLAAVAAVFCPDLARFATGGLETAAFTFLAVTAFCVLTFRPIVSPRQALLGGLLMGLLTLTRQDGAIFMFLGGLFVLWRGEHRLKTGLLYGAVSGLIFFGFLAWRVAYYGDVFPNTYYAKSANLSWYDQGLTYLLLFFTQYWVLYLAPVLLLGATILSRRHINKERATDTTLVLATAFCVAYTAYVMKVGGDFMFARFLVPTIPFLLIVTERLFVALLKITPRWYYAGSVALLAGLLLSPSPIPYRQSVQGIVNEPQMYAPEIVTKTDYDARILKKYLHDLPVRAAYLGGEARLMYRAEIPYAVESETGLTDYWIARQKLTRRGRIGHEKNARIEDLKARSVHLVFHPRARDYLHMDRAVSPIRVEMEGVTARVIHWDDDLMRRLQARGAVIMRESSQQH